MTQFASAIADLRLSGEKLNQDAATVRSQLLRLTQRLEQEAKIQLSVGIDVRRAQRDLQQAVSRFAQSGAFNVPVGLDTDRALEDLIALGTIDDPVIIPVVADTDQALDDLIALTSIVADEPAVIRVEVDDAAAVTTIQNIENRALPGLDESFAVAGDSAGRSFADGLGSSVFRAVGGLSIALGAFTATALVRGFNRLTTIQDATASLTVALESTTQAAVVLDDVLDVVRGTPFNLDQFALAASNLISFGVEAEKVPGFLEAIAEASASRGGRANEFAQRLANTFGQISVQGRITGEDILSLQATGVDALRILGNSFGETTIDIRELISEGVIPADEALDILAEGILNGSTGINGATVAFAGTAERLRETLTGAIGGFESATARLGESIIGPFDEALTTGFNAATDIVDQFTETFDELLFGLTNTDGFENFVEQIASLPDLVDPVLEALAEFGPALAPLAAGFGALGINQLTGFLGAFGVAIPGINALTVAIIALVAATPELREQVLPILGDLGETLVTLGAGLGQAFGDAIEELTPLLASFAEGIGELTPFVTDIATFTVALANGLVPVLGFLADVLDFFPIEILAALGGGLLVFKGLNNLTGPVDGLTRSISNFGAQLQLAEVDADRFGNRWTNVADRVGVSGQQINRASKAISTGLDVAASSAAGFFSGFALASEDATTKALGFAGAATSIATAFAAGGPVGGIVATAGVVGGALVKMWTDSKQAAEEYRDNIEDIADKIIEDLDAATARLVEAQDLVDNLVFQEEAIELIGQDTVDRIKELGILLPEVFDAARDPNFAATLEAGLDQAEREADIAASKFIGNFQRANSGADPDPEAVAAVYAQTLVASLQDELIAFGDVIDLGALINADALTELPTAIAGTIPTFDLEALDGLRLVAETVEQIGGAAEASAATTRAAQSALDDLLDLEVGNISKALELDDEDRVAFRAAVDELELDADELKDAFREADDEVEAFFGAERQLAKFDITPFDLLLKGVADVQEEFGVLIEISDDGELSITKNLEDIGESGLDAGADLEAAFAAADAAADRFTRTLEGQLEVLDKIANEQNFIEGFENIAATLGEIVNQDDLDQAQKLVEQIGDGRRSIADLQADLADEQADANREIANLERRIADAEAFGAVEGAAALRAERDGVLSDVADAERDVRDQIAEVAALEQELASISSQVPVTFEQLLRGQAADRGISLAELLISPEATPEARDFFQGAISNQINAFGAQIQQAFDDNPLLASIELPDLTETFIQGLVARGGIDEATARELVNLAINPQRLALEARNSFDEAFAADLATLDSATQALLRGEEIDPSINVEATVEDVGNGIAALQELERLGLEVPGDVDLVAAQESLSAFTSAYEESDFALLIPVEGDLTTIISQLEGLEEYSIQLTLQSPTFSRTPVRGSTSSGRGRSRGTDPFEGFDFGGGVRAFLDGGFYGSENHVAQIGKASAGTIGRFWGEPETGGEAYIPLGNSKRSRSTQILSTVADIFGMDVIPRSRGAASAAATAFTEESMSRAVEKGVTRARGVPGPAARAAAHDRAARSVNVEKIEVSGVRDPARAARKMIRSLSDVAMGLNDWDDEF